MSRKKLIQAIAMAVLLIIVPALISGTIFRNYEEVPDPKTILVIQPNIDPYEKFVSIPSEEQTMVQINEAAVMADGSVDYFIGPETSINHNIWLHMLEDVPDIQMIRRFMESYPKASYITGIQCARLLGDEKKSTAATRIMQPGGQRYEVYNASIQIDSTDKIPYYFQITACYRC
jgi:apolipoprotein N-acyltransferase